MPSHVLSHSPPIRVAVHVTSNVIDLKLIFSISDKVSKRDHSADLEEIENRLMSRIDEKVSSKCTLSQPFKGRKEKCIVM